MPDPFTFDESTHICHNERGEFVPSSTQIIESMNLSTNFDRLIQRGTITRDLLDRRGRIGKEGHAFSDFHDKYGSIDPSWLNIDNAGFVESWIGFKRISGFIPQEWSVRYCETINGLQFTGELDNFGLLNGKPAILDKKTSSSRSDSWGLQLSSYEMLRFRSTRVGRVIRGVVHLNVDGKPGKLIEYGEFSPVDGISYPQTFLAALHCVHAALRRGYLTERDFIDQK